MAVDRADGLTRRRFLAVSAGVAASAALSACTGRSPGSSASSTRVGPHSAAVIAAERAREVAGAPTLDVRLGAVATQIDLGGPVVSTWAYDGVLPGKEIRVARGQRLRVELGNQLPQPSTVHWHGVALRNDMDGVPNLTQDAVSAGESFRYDFTVPESGTFWFHPHVGTQLDRGLYAPLIVEDPSDGAGYDDELVVVVDDWLDGLGRSPDTVLADLRRSGMGGMGSMGGMSASASSMPTTSQMSQSAVLGGDAGDVTYPYYLANGRIAAAPRVVTTKPAQRLRLRLINAGSDTAFRIGMPGQQLQITHTDGFPVEPITADAVLLGMGERIDAVIVIPDSSVPLLIVPEGKPGYAQVGFRVGSAALPDPAGLIPAFLARPVLMSTAPRAAASVRLGSRAPDVTHTLILAGPASNYRWTINGNTYNPAEGLPVRQGQFVRLRFENRTTMFHPMHLHGHTFQVRTAAVDGPRKDTVLVLPGRTVEVDFTANNPGQWLTHCHNIYHGEAGMMTVLSYIQ